jgi:HlyD family secretion protein
MKLIKLFSAVLIVCGMLFLSVSCSSSSSSTSTTKIVTTTVKTGDLSISITGTGNLAYAKTEKLAFEMAGYVEEVLVSAGDTVVEGQELVKLNTSDWEDQITALKKQLVNAQRSLAKAERTVGDKQLAVVQAEISLQSAEYNLKQITPVKQAQASIDSIETDIVFAQNMLRVPGEDTSYWRERLDELQDDLKAAKQKLQDIISGKGINISDSVAIQISQLELKVEQSERDVEDARLAVEDAKLDQADSEVSVQDAQNALNKANNKSPIIKAPFDGYITKVNVSGGDEIQKGTVAVQISDPTEFQADILVAESDIYSVNLGGEATVSLDALSDSTYPATITKISPTATVSSGVVNYEVVVTLSSLVPNSTGQSTSSQLPASPAMGAAATGFQTDRKFTASSSSDNKTKGAVSTSTSQSVTLMDGLSATVEIISAQAKNALIIPSKAITQQGPNYTVQVVKGTTTETRTVKIGITDGTNTVITDGLTAGEQISYSTKSTSSSASTTATNNNMGVPGIGGGGPPAGGGF